MSEKSTDAAHDHSAHDHAAHDHAAHDHSAHDHAAHDHAAHDHAAHDHSAHDHSGHGGHAGHDPAMFRKRFWVTLILSVPTLVFSTGLQNILGLSGPRFPGSEWIPAAFGAAIFVYGGWVFLRGAVDELRAKRPGMMTLISLAIVVAFAYSAAVTLGLEGMDFWWELATLIVIMLLGHWLEMTAVMGAQDALGELAKLLPDEAERVADPDADSGETVALSALAAGDLVLVRPGAAIPADGEVVAGEAEVDESMLTGESVPVEKSPSSAVSGGTVVRGGTLTVRITALGDESALGGVMRLVSEAQAAKSGTQLLADRAAGWLFGVAVVAAVITAIVWVLVRPEQPDFVLERVVTVLVIACPHALGLAIPLVALLTTSIGAKRGVLIRDRAALEDARRTDVVVFDKTGTLTRGELTVDAVVAVEGGDEDELLALAAAVEARAEHPIARAIVEAAKAGKLRSAGRASGFRSQAGRGASATVAGRSIRLGGPRLLTESAIHLPAELVHAAREQSGRGAAVIHVLEGDTPLGLIAVRDTVRAESAEAVRLLQKRGMRVAMLTGDAHPVAEAVAAELGIEEVYSEVLPEQKAQVIEALQAGRTPRIGHVSAPVESGSVEPERAESEHAGARARVAMVGDGVNDAPALATADLGIAIGAGTDVAIEAAGVVLASSDPRGVVDTVILSRAAYRKMLQNLAWATGYNVIGLPLAAGVLAPIGFIMPPAVGAIVMSVSTIVVALNAQLLRFTRFAR